MLLATEASLHLALVDISSPLPCLDTSPAKEGIHSYTLIGYTLPPAIPDYSGSKKSSFQAPWSAKTIFKAGRHMWDPIFKSVRNQELDRLGGDLTFFPPGTTHSLLAISLMFLLLCKKHIADHLLCWPSSHPGRE